MDVKNMEFLPMDCFNLVIDKGTKRRKSRACSKITQLMVNRLCCAAGLFDTQLCTENNLNNVELQLHEVWRVLKPGGTYFIVSHGLPATRLGYLSRGLAWNVEYKEIGAWPSCDVLGSGMC